MERISNGKEVLLLLKAPMQIRIALALAYLFE
jgi:hypothetical protein